MWRKWKAWYAEEPDVAIALTVVAICAVIGPVLYFNYRPCFKIATTIGFYAFCVLYGLIALVALVIAPFVIYMFIIEPVRDWYIERKYGWAKARNPQFREWLAPRVQKLREIGFLKEFDDLSEKQRLTRVVSRLNKRFDLPAVVHYPCLSPPSTHSDAGTTTPRASAGVKARGTSSFWANSPISPAERSTPRTSPPNRRMTENPPCSGSATTAAHTRSASTPTMTGWIRRSSPA